MDRIQLPVVARHHNYPIRVTWSSLLKTAIVDRLIRIPSQRRQAVIERLVRAIWPRFRDA